MKEFTDRKRSIASLMVFNFLNNISFERVLWVIYLLDKNISLIEIGIIQSAINISMFIFELPTGYIGDKWGRKSSILIGNIIILFYLMIFLFSDSFLMFLLGAVCYGIGMTFISGSNEALVYDNLKYLDEEDKYNGILSKINFYSILGLLSSIFIGGVVGNYFLKNIFIFGIVIRILTSFLIMYIKELPYTIEDSIEKEQDDKRLNLQTYKNLIIFLIVSSLFVSFFSIYVLFGQQILVVNNFKNIFNISNLFVLLYSGGAVVSLLYKKISAVFTYDKLLLLNGILIFLLLLLTLDANINKYYYLVFIAVGSLYEINDITYNIVVNKMTQSHVRARIFSLYSLITTIFMSIFSILITAILMNPNSFNYNFLFIASVILGISTIIAVLITQKVYKDNDYAEI